MLTVVVPFTGTVRGLLGEFAVLKSMTIDRPAVAPPGVQVTSSMYAFAMSPAGIVTAVRKPPGLAELIRAPVSSFHASCQEGGGS